MIRMTLPHGEVATIRKKGVAKVITKRTQMLLDSFVDKVTVVGDWHPDPVHQFAADLAALTGGKLDMSEHKQPEGGSEGVH